MASARTPVKELEARLGVKLLEPEEEDEIDTLNRLVVIFLEQAELRVKQRGDLTLDFWRKHVDAMLELNGQVVLQNAGSVIHEDMLRIAHARYDIFDQHRRTGEALDADAADLQEIEQLEKQVGHRAKTSPKGRKT